MDIQIINEDLLNDLFYKAAGNERRRMNFDLRTSPEDTSQRMLNALEAGSIVPIHRHEETDETVVCLKGRLDEVFYKEVDGQFEEIDRVSLCPAENVFGVQIPQGVWHTVEVFEPSVIFEAKDGKYVSQK